MTQHAIKPWNLLLQDFIQIDNLDRLEGLDMGSTVYIKISVTAIQNKQTKCQTNETQMTSASREYRNVF